MHRNRLALVVALLLALPLADLPASASPAARVAAVRPALTATPAHPLQGTSTVLRTKLPTQGRRPTALERFVNGAWRVQARKKSQANGRVAYGITAIGPTTWRIRARAVRLHGKRRPAVVSRNLALRPTPRAVLMSRRPNGTSPGKESGYVTLSGNGRYVAFHSSATDLVPGFSGFPDEPENVYLRDRATGTTTLVSAADTDSPGNSDSVRPAISRDGRYVTYVSYASDLVANDLNGHQDVFRWDRVTGTTIRISETNGGAGANADSYDPSISADGDRIAYSTDASNIDTDDDNGVSDIYVWDSTTDASTRVSTSSFGSAGNGTSMGAWISDNGAYVAFGSNASNLVFNDTNGTSDIFRKSIDGGALALVTRGADVQDSDDYTSFGTIISADGRYVGFGSAADNLVVGGSPDNGKTNTFVRDMTAGTTTLISRDHVSGPLNDYSFAPGSISDDGSLVMFSALASDIVAGDTNGAADAFLWNRSTGKATRVVRDLLWGQVNGSIYEPRLSADGKTIAFYSVANDLSSADPNKVVDAYVWRR